jgi:hypothetical protein
MVGFVRRKRLYLTSYRKRHVHGLKAVDLLRVNKIKAKVEEYEQYKEQCISNHQYEEAVFSIDCMLQLSRELFNLEYVLVNEWKESVPRLQIDDRKRSFDSFADAIDEMFGFSSVAQLRELKKRLRIGDTVSLDNHATLTGEEMMMVALHRLRGPKTLRSLQRIFARDYSVISRTTNYFMRFLVAKWGHLVLNNIAYWADSLGLFCEVIREKRQEMIRRREGQENAVVKSFQEDAENGFKVCVFIDATAFSTTRPGGGPVYPGGEKAERIYPDEQRAFYTKVIDIFKFFKYRHGE